MVYEQKPSKQNCKKHVIVWIIVKCEDHIKMPFQKYTILEAKSKSTALVKNIKLTLVSV